LTMSKTSRASLRRAGVTVWPEVKVCLNDAMLLFSL